MNAKERTTRRMALVVALLGAVAGLVSVTTSAAATEPVPCFYTGTWGSQAVRPECTGLAAARRIVTWATAPATRIAPLAKLVRRPPNGKTIVFLQNATTTPLAKSAG